MLWEDGRYKWSKGMTNAQRIDVLVKEVFPTYLDQFISFDPERRNIMKEYGVRADLFVCSDPRVHTDFFGVHDGEIFVKRGIGGKFNLGYPTFRAKFSKVLDMSKEKGLYHIVFPSYHFSKGKHKGCAGHRENEAVAKKYALGLFEQMKNIFADKRHVVPIMCGLNTDNGEVIFHGHDNTILACSSCADKSDSDVYQKLFYMYKGVSDSVLHYLLRLVRGNVRHMKERPVDLDVLQNHNECFIGYGEGFFAFPRGRIMVVNPFTNPFSKDSHLIDAFRIQKGLQEKGVIKKGFVMATGAIYDRKEDIEWATLESLDYMKTAMNVIQEFFPELRKLAAPLPTIMNRETREVTVVPYRLTKQ